MSWPARVAEAGCSGSPGPFDRSRVQEELDHIGRADDGPEGAKPEGLSQRAAKGCPDEPQLH